MANVERLRELRRVVEAAPPERFDMSVYTLTLDTYSHAGDDDARDALEGGKP